MLRLIILIQILIAPVFLHWNDDMKNSHPDKIVSVIAVYRHGDRTPISPYPLDPYKNRSWWPVDFGQLTNKGKVQQYGLGKWLRYRYKDFLPEMYSEKDVYVRSTDVDRTLMSAQVNLAALFPPVGDEIWKTNLLWQPIPVHTVPAKDDILSDHVSCPRHKQLLNDLLNTEEFIEIQKKNQELYEYLSQNSGAKITNLHDLEYLYNTLYIEALYKLRLPDWTKRVYPKMMKYWADFSFSVPCYTENLARLKVGPFFDEITKHLVNASLTDTAYKFVAYSAHDTTIANILKALNAFEIRSPPYASTIIFELRNVYGKYFITILYNYVTSLDYITVKGCKYYCPLEKFLNIVKPITVSHEEWVDECKIKFEEDLPVTFTPVQLSALVACVGILCVSVTSVVIGISVISSRFKMKRTFIRKDYLRIPSEGV